MSPTKRCLVCPNTSRNNPKLIFVQMPHPKKEAKSRKAWFVVYEDVLEYNDQLDCYLCSDHFDLENDASNLEYYMAKRMKKLLFKPHALPKPLPPAVFKESWATIKEEPLEHLDNEEDQLSDTYSHEDQASVSVKEEPLDIYDHEIRNDPVDIKFEPHEEAQEISGPSPPPLLPAAELQNMQQAMPGTQQQPLVINSFQIANPQLRSQLLRLAAQGRLRVVNVSNVDKPGDTTPTLAVLGGEDLNMNAAAGLIQAAPSLVRLQTPGPPQLVRKPVQVQQPLPQVRHMMVAQNQVGPQIRLINMSPHMGQMMNIRPMSAVNTTQSFPGLTTTNNQSTILRQQLILPRGARIFPNNPTTTGHAPINTPSLVPLPMRSVFACGKCTELFYTTDDRDRHIKTRHPGSLYIGTGANSTATGGGAKLPKTKMGVASKVKEKTFKCEICQATMFLSQKLSHLGTHETFKCVTCHQTLEKRIYATHMMSHIDNQPIVNNNNNNNSIKRNVRTYTKQRPKSLVEQQSTTRTRMPKLTTSRKTVKSNPAHSTKDVTIYEVQKGTSSNDPDVESNLHEYMIPTELEFGEKLLARSGDPDGGTANIGAGMEMYYLYNCKICRKVFRTKPALVAHQEMYHKRTMSFIKCDYCLEDVLRIKMKHHIHLMHPDKIYLCPHCQAAFSHHHSYARHLRIAHKDMNRTLNQSNARLKQQHHHKRGHTKDPQPIKTSIKNPVPISETPDNDDMDYDEDYPLAMLIRQSNDGNVEPIEAEVDVAGMDEMDDEDEQVDDSPDYVDIAQYQVTT